MDIQEKIVELQALMDIPPTSEKFIIHPGEVPWWDIEDLIERNRVWHRQWMRVEYKLHPDRHAGAVKRYYSRHPEYLPEKKKKYNRAPKGRAKEARMMARRREHSTGPELYGTRIELLHTLQEPCAKCHTSYRITHQIDHILALCLGGTDDWENLQPLCIACHRPKTVEDLRKYREKLSEEGKCTSATMVGQIIHIGEK